MLEYYRFKVIHDLFMKGQAEEACIQLRALQKRYIEQCEENSALRAQVREFEDILFLARNFIFDGNFYWLITGSIKQGPFCPSCYNRDGQLVRITEMSPRACPTCGEVFKTARMPRTPSTADGSTARAVEQAPPLGSLRAFAALEQLAQNQLAQNQLAQTAGRLNQQEAPAPRAKAKIIPLQR